MRNIDKKKLDVKMFIIYFKTKKNGNIILPF